MSRSDPLLKIIKDYIVQLRTHTKPIRDDHPSVQAFCETLEKIFRKGLKANKKLFQQKKDYWNWIEAIAEGNHTSERINPIFSMLVSTIKSSGKVLTNQGRGRLFIRAALQKKVISVPIEQLVKNNRSAEWYEEDYSILGDEILSEILMSLLFEATEINFKLNPKNASFLDETWTMPVFKQYEFVPCTDMGIQLQFIDGRCVTTAILAGSVADEDGKIEEGDVIDELYGESLREVKKSKLTSLMKLHQGLPVYMAVVKAKMCDGMLYPPVVELISKAGKDVDAMRRLAQEGACRAPPPSTPTKKASPAKRPPHAQLPEDDMDEVPVHAEDKAKYCVQFLGKIEIGHDGGVNQIEGAIGGLLKERTDKHITDVQEMSFELGETDIIISKIDTEEVLWRHSYTEVSSCGRRVDCTEYFAYVAGALTGMRYPSRETTCTLARQFLAYIFKAEDEIESKTILCSIAQGFGRTHWYV